MGAHRVIVRPGGVGDTLLLAPALATIRASATGAITLVGYRERLEILAEAGLADSVVELDSWLHNPVDFINQETPIDSFFPQSAPGLTTQTRFHPPFPSEIDSVHVAEHIAQRLGVPLPMAPTAPLSNLVPSGVDRRRIWIHPGAGSLDKRWPLKSFLGFAETLTSAGWDAQFLLGEAEEGMAGEIEVAGFRSLSKTRLREIPKLWTLHDVFVGNDSGLTHLAALCGLSTLAVFGPSDPVRWRPWGPRAGWIQRRPVADWPSVSEVVNAFLMVITPSKTLTSD